MRPGSLECLLADVLGEGLIADDGCGDTDHPLLEATHEEQRCSGVSRREPGQEHGVRQFPHVTVVPCRSRLVRRGAPMPPGCSELGYLVHIAALSPDRPQVDSRPPRTLQCRHGYGTACQVRAGADRAERASRSTLSLLIRFEFVDGMIVGALVAMDHRSRE